MRNLVALTLMIVTSQVHALQIERIEAPKQTLDERDCYSLSAEVSELSRNQPAGSNGYWQKGDNRAAAALSLFVPVPAAAFLGYRAYWSARDDITAKESIGQIGALRSAMAQKNCFVK
ncbi:MAG: hypothetical protein K0U93_12850 [Gammaproteobacteria bacterium]|nr:hypothetical protein [Gammaproteobacteria bacterium]